jgi:transposase
LILPHGIKIMLCLAPTDMRCGFDGLSNRVRNELGGDPLDGTLFVFRGRSRTRLKILYWDKDGLAVWSKRLEAGTFKFPTVADTNGSKLIISATDLAMLLDGVDLDRIKRGKRFAFPTP